MTTMTSTEHIVPNAQLRCEIVQREYQRKWQPGHWLPEIERTFNTLPQQISDLIAGGHPLSAEYWLFNAEKFTGCISAEEFQRYVTELGAFHVWSEIHRCDCEPGDCMS